MRTARRCAGARRVARHRCAERHCSAGAGGAPVRKIYELVTQDVHPAQFKSFLEQTSNFIHIRASHSHLLSYCTTEIGGQNQVVSLWEYNSLEHRLQTAEKLRADPKYQQSYIDIVKPMLQSENNQLLLWAPTVEGLKTSGLPQTPPPRCTPEAEPRWSQPTGCFRLVEAHLPRTLASRNAYLKNVVHRAKADCDASDRDVQLFGVWFSAFCGAYNNCFSLWHAKDPDDLLYGGVSHTAEGNWVLDEDPHSFPSHGKLLVPCGFSRRYATWS